MKTKNIPSILILTFLLNPFSPSVLACGDHDLEMLKGGQPLVHQSLMSRDKQFPDPRTRYDSIIPDHRGMSPWYTTSLKGQKKLALTYDDGPHPTNTPKLLDILKQYNVKATFFVMGELARRYPAITKRIVDEGHILASHDWRHDNSNSESEATFKWGLKESIKEVKKHYTKQEAYYRFPYGAYARAQGYHHLNALREVSYDLFDENCINFAFWDIDTSDWVANMTPQNIVSTLWANLEGGEAWRFRTVRRGGRTYYEKQAYRIDYPKEGGVVLMHDIHSRTVAATELFLRSAVKKNIDFVLLNQVDEFLYHQRPCQLQASR